MRFAKPVLSCVIQIAYYFPGKSQRKTSTLQTVFRRGLKSVPVMDMVGYFTDVIGPRLTGSPNLQES